ncbi:amidohydrolase family protein [Paenibacillus turpanensis]|uniref:amidohydrolase family protein n=1 Tax=Paenibacillus turpanensis TaxID=2689078 RepID=UPI00140C3B91|nr:amidohydrolase family protein [Paenibacillus turpanensis]
MRKGDITFINVSLPLEDPNHLFELSIRGGRWNTVQRQPHIQDSLTHIPISNAGVEPSPDGLIDLEGRMLLPGFVDAHMHLDKAYSIYKVGNKSGTLLEAIDNYRESVQLFSKEEITKRMVKAAMRAASFGSVVLRSHLDFPARWGKEVVFRTIEAALEAREKVRPYIDLQFFPMVPYDPEQQNEINDWVEEAFRMGIDGLGGAPHLSPDPAAHVEWAFRKAVRHDKSLDLHVDESDDPMVQTIDDICRETIRWGYQHKVNAGHLCALAAREQEDAERVISLMAEAGVGAITLPAVNLYLQGRGDKGTVRRGVTRVKELLGAGIPVAAASDNIQDPFHPFGKGDLVQIGLVTAYAAHMAGEREMYDLLHMITSHPAQLTGLTDYGVKPGNTARFVVVDACHPREMFTEVPGNRWVYNHGRWISVMTQASVWPDFDKNAAAVL